MEEDKAKIQEKYITLQNLDKQIKQLQAQFQNLENQAVEFHVVKNSLDILSNTKLNNELLVPVCNGIFMKTILRENTEVVINVGANIAVKKTIIQAKDLMDVQMAEVKKIQKNVLTDMQQLSEQALSLEKEINEYVAAFARKE